MVLVANPLWEMGFAIVPDDPDVEHAWLLATVVMHLFVWNVLSIE